MKLARYVLFSVFLAKANANCECNEVDSWDTFKDLVVAGNEVESSSPQKIVLCPFKITKVIYENTGTSSCQSSNQCTLHATSKHHQTDVGLKLREEITAHSTRIAVEQ
jgi:hypothetical protein